MSFDLRLRHCRRGKFCEVKRVTRLEKTIKRLSAAKRFAQSKHRAIIVTLEASQKVGVRLDGTRQTYRLDLESVYELAVRSYGNRLEKKTREIAKRDGIRIRSARVKARKELAIELK